MLPDLRNRWFCLYRFCQTSSTGHFQVAVPVAADGPGAAAGPNMLLGPLRCVLLELAWPRCGFLPRCRLVIVCTHLFKKYLRTCRCLDHWVVRGTWEGLLNIEATCFDILIFVREAKQGTL